MNISHSVLYIMFWTDPSLAVQDDLLWLCILALVDTTTIFTVYYYGTVDHGELKLWIVIMRYRAYLIYETAETGSGFTRFFTNQKPEVWVLMFIMFVFLLVVKCGCCWALFKLVNAGNYGFRGVVCFLCFHQCRLAGGVMVSTWTFVCSFACYQAREWDNLKTNEPNSLPINDMKRSGQSSRLQYGVGISIDPFSWVADLAPFGKVTVEWCELRHVFYYYFFAMWDVTRNLS